MNKSVINVLKYALAVGMLFLGACKNADPKLSERNESSAERAESIKTAFVTGADFTDIEEQRDIADRVINQFGKALQNKSEDGLERSFSSKNFINYCFQVSSKSISTRKKKQLMVWMQNNFINMLIQQSEAWAFHETEILNVDVISDQEMAVYTKQWDNSMEVYTRTRWWLIEEDSKWKIYDFEDMDSMFKFSSLMISGIEFSNKGVKWLTAFKRLSDGVNNSEDLLSIDFTKMESDSSMILKSSAPEDFKKVALMFYLRALIDSEQYDEVYMIDQNLLDLF